MSATNLSVIIVNYNAGHYLGDCLRSLFDQTSDGPLEVIIVDNASTDGSIAPVRATYPQVKIVANNSNAGFAAASNQGINQASGNFILLLNPDTQVFPGTIKKTMAFLKQTPEAGIVGCRLLDETREPYSSYRTFPTAWDYLFDSLFLTKLFPGSRLFGRFYLTNKIFIKPTEVDVVQGAFFLLKRELLDDIGLLDERFFLYAEDRDYCFRAKAAGWKVFVYPDAEAMHIGGASARHHAPEMFIQQIKSTLLFHRKYDSNRSAKRIKAILLLGVVLRVILWGSLAVFVRSSIARSRRLIYITTLRWFLKLPVKVRVVPGRGRRV